MAKIAVTEQLKTTFQNQNKINKLMGLLERQLSFLQEELKYDIVADNEGRRLVLELISIFTMIIYTKQSVKKGQRMHKLDFTLISIIVYYSGGTVVNMGRSRSTVVNSYDVTTCPSWVQVPNRMCSHT